jgi:hypothetical protein
MARSKSLLVPEEVRELIERAVVLSEDYGEEVEAAVRAAAEHPLDSARARRLYTRVLEILRGINADGISDGDRARIAQEIRQEAEDIVNAVSRPAPEDNGVPFMEWNGLKQHAVVPTPVFNEKAIPMTEGYVKLEDLKLWRGNHRLELHVQEFRERNGREPSDDELVKIMQGAIDLPSLGKTDPFKLRPLADSIARKGVERPPIVSYDGIPQDGNRRIAASLLVLYGKDYTEEQKERARYIRAWRAPKGTTEDQFDAIVVALNFESDHKEPWPEYIKAGLVVDYFDARREELRGRTTASQIKKIKEDVAKRFAIKVQEVTRYVNMVRWADDFHDYHVEEGRDPATVRYKTDKIFQWFYEIDAGRGDEKLTRKIETDDTLKSIVYDLMFDVLDSGAQVRELHRVVADAETAQMLLKAHEVMHKDPDEALRLVDDAIIEAKRRNVKRRAVGFDQFLKTMLDRLGTTPPDQWGYVDTDLLLDVKRVFQATLGAIDGQITVRSAAGETIDE